LRDEKMMKELKKQIKFKIPSDPSEIEGLKEIVKELINIYNLLENIEHQLEELEEIENKEEKEKLKEKYEMLVTRQIMGEIQLEKYLALTI